MKPPDSVFRSAADDEVKSSLLQSRREAKEASMSVGVDDLDAVSTLFQKVLLMVDMACMVSYCT